MASALLAGSPQAVFAEVDGVQTVMQSGTVKGQIVDVNGESIIGASVQVKGTGTGVISDINGNFIVNAHSNAYTGGFVYRLQNTGDSFERKDYSFCCFARRCRNVG